MSEHLQKIYEKIGVAEIVYTMCDAKKFSSDFIDYEKLKELLPIDYAWNGYWSNKVEFKDKRTNKTYTDEWDRNDEADRLRVLKKVNKLIQDFNDFYASEKERLGIEANWAKWGYTDELDYPLWAFNVYCIQPTTWKYPPNNPKLVNEVRLDNEHCYIQGLNLTDKNFCIAFNKMIYQWIINMLPKSFNDGRSKFISSDHLLYHPKLEFENWFQAKGVMLDFAPSLTDINTLPKDDITDLSTIHNQLRVTTQKLQEEREKNKLLKSKPYRQRFDEDLKSGQLEIVIDEKFRTKGKGRIIKSKLADYYGCTDKTILDLLIKYAPHLLRNDDAKYLIDRDDVDEEPELLT